jgi:hypothetical protein
MNAIVKKCANPKCTTKPIECFGADKSRKGGRHKYCKDCDRLRAVAYRKANPEKVRLSRRAYCKANPEKVRAYAQKPERKERHLIRQRSRDRVRAGKLQKLPCVVCGNPHSEIHHPDYNQPFAGDLVVSKPPPRTSSQPAAHSMTRSDRRAADQEERRKFEFIQKFVSECRSHWPGAKIILRASDSACIDLNTSKPKGNESAKEI